MNSGRITGITGITSGTHSGRIVAATAGGGIWTTDDRGSSWTPRTDQSPNMAIDGVAVDPSNADHLIAGTGEADQCSDCFSGSGILSSTDGGTTWVVQNPGGVFSGQHVAQVAIDPANSNHMFAATDGGLFVTSNGGAAWAKPSDASYAGVDGSVTAVVLDPTAPKTVYLGGGAAMVAKSTDGGATWAAAKSGIGTPGATPYIALAIAASNSSTLYASVGSTGPVALYKTTNGGGVWSAVGAAPDYTGQAFSYGPGNGTSEQGWYDNVLAIDPANANHVLAGGIALVETTDGGANWTNVNGQAFGGGGTNLLHPDHHALWFGADGKVWVGNDGGVFLYDRSGPAVSNANGNLNITQFYFGFNEVGGVVLAGAQDNASARTSSGSASAWTGIFSGDGGPSAITPNNTSLQFIEADQDLYVTSDGFASVQRKITPPNVGLFTPPILVVANTADPSNPTVFYGGPDLFRTTNPSAANPTWAKVTTNGSYVSALAASPTDPKVVYAGFKGGAVAVSSDGGQSFTSLKSEPFGEQFVTGLSVDPSNPKAITASVSNNDTRSVASFPHVAQYSYSASPGSGSWTVITGNLPSTAAVSRVVYDGGALVAATDDAVYGTDTPSGSGTSWTLVGTGLPGVQVQDLFVDPVTHDLYAVTHGRGAWKLTAAFHSGDVFIGVASGKVQWRGADGQLKATLDTGANSFTTGMAFDKVGNLYVTDFGASQISRFNQQGQLIGTFGSGFSSTPESILFDKAGNAYVGQEAGGVLKFDSNGNSVKSFPTGRSDWIELGPDQCTLFYTDEGTSIHRYDVCQDQAMADFVPGGTLQHPFALRLLPSGGLLVADSSVIRRFDENGHQVQQYSFAGNSNWFALNLDPDGTSFYSADFGTSSVVKFDIASGNVLLNYSTGTGSDTVFGIIVNGELTTGAGAEVFGTVKDAGGKAVVGALVQACPHDGGSCFETTSDPSGSYHLSGIHPGNFDLEAFPPGSSTLVPAGLGPLALAAGQTQPANFVLQAPGAPPKNVTVAPVLGTIGGIPIVNFATPFNLSISGCPGGTASYRVSPLLGFLVGDASGSMSETAAGSGVYQAAVTPSIFWFGPANVAITLICPGGKHADVAFTIYIDPSGKVVTETGQPIAGATVTLSRSDGPFGPFVAVADGSALMSPMNRANPDTSASDGHFGWDVIGGFYKIRAEKSGCTDPNNSAVDFVDSTVLQIPPPISGLQLTLRCGSPPAITSVNQTTFTVGAAGNFTVTTTGSPMPAVTESGALPAGVRFVDNHDGTAKLSGTPSSGTAGGYTLAITASNGVAPDATQTLVLTVAKAASTTTLSTNLSTTSFGSPVTFTASVAPSAANTLSPSGTVNFYLDGQATPVATQVLTSGRAIFATAGLGAGAHAITASYSGDTNFTPSSSASPLTETVSCTRTVTGTFASALLVTSGSTCLINARVGGSVTVQAGAALDVENSSIGGSLTANSPMALRVCGLTTTPGGVSIRSATGFVLVGDAGDDGCGPNSVAGGLVLQNNGHGLEAIGNHVSGAVVDTGNSGAGAFPEDAAPEVTGNGPR